jgi:c-di-GMP-binding flagellar brake protein YcgR
MVYTGRIAMKKTVFFVGCGAATANATSLLEHMGWRQASGPVIIAILIVILAVLIVLMAYYYVRRYKERLEKNIVAGEKFDETCERMGISETEKNKLRQLLGHEKLMQPQVILQSVSVFEKCVDAEIKRILSHGPAPDMLKNENALITSLRRKAGFQFLPQDHPLASSRNIALGQVGAVFGASHQNPIIGHVSVAEKDEFTFTLQYNSDKEEVIHVAPGNSLKFAFTRQNDGLYGVQVVVESVETGSLKFYHTIDIRRNQLRQYMRVDINLPMKFRLLKTVEPEKSQVTGGEVAEAHIADISGGGLSFLCDRSLRPGDLLSATFSLPVGSFSGLLCKVLRISLQEGKTRTLYRHHTQFVNLETRKRDMVVRYVFEKQRQVSQWR